MKLELKKLGLIGTFLFSGLFLSSCLNNDDGPVIPDQSGFMLFVNTSPGTNGLKYFANGEAVTMPALNYNELYGYTYQEVGETNFTIRTGSVDLDTLSLDVDINRYYSLFAVNTPDNIELVAYQDNPVAISTPNKASIRFLQLSHNTPLVKVAIEGMEENLGIYYFKQASSFMEIDNIFNKNIYLINAETNDTILSKPLILEAGKTYSVFSEGIYGSDNENLDLDVQLITL